jgi:hypothetical protein
MRNARLLGILLIALLMVSTAAAITQTHIAKKDTKQPSRLASISNAVTKALNAIKTSINKISTNAKEKQSKNTKANDITIRPAKRLELRPASPASSDLKNTGTWRGALSDSTELHISKTVSGDTTVGGGFTISVTATDSDDLVTRISLGRYPYNPSDFDIRECAPAANSCTISFTMRESTTGTYSYFLKAKNERDEIVNDAVTVTVVESSHARTFTLRTAALDGSEHDRGRILYVNSDIGISGEGVLGLEVAGRPFATFSIPSDTLLTATYAAEGYREDNKRLYLDTRLPTCSGTSCTFTRTFGGATYTTSCSLAISDYHYNCLQTGSGETLEFEYRATTDPVGPNTVRIYNPIYSMSAPIVEFGTLDASFMEGRSLTIPLDDYATDADTSDSQLRWTVSRNRNINVNIDATTHQARLTAGTDWIGGEILQFMATDPEGNRGSDVITARVLRDDNDPPVILSKDPNTTTANVGFGSSRSFSITAMDPDYDPLNITWRKGGTVVAENTFSYSYADSDGIPHPLSVIVSDGTHETAEAWDINLVEPIGTVEGTVRERGTSTLLNDVLVELLDEGSTIIVGRTGTDAAGHYSITIHEGRYDLRFTKAGYHEVLIRGIVVNPGETLMQDAEMSISTGRGTVQGTVTDATDSSPIRDALVEAINSTGIVGSAPTDASGHYTMELGEGVYTLRFSKIGYAMREVAGVVITSDATTTQNAALEETTVTTGTIEGTVTNEGTGATVSGALVELLSGMTVVDSTTTSPTGTYSITVDAGIYDLRFSKAGYKTETRAGVNIPAGATTTLNFAMMKWWDATYGVKYPITIDADSGLSADTPFAIKLVLNSSNIDYSNFQSDGGDVRFVDSTETTELPYFIEVWNSSGTSIVYVGMSVSHTSSRTVYLYGNASIPQTSTGAFTGTFGSELVALYPMNQDSNDLSDNGYIGTAIGVAYTRDDADIIERLFGNYGFDGSSSIDTSYGADIVDGVPFSFSVWAKSNSVDSTARMVYSNQETSKALVLLYQTNDNKWSYYNYDRTTLAEGKSTATITPGQWYHLVYVFDGIDQHKLYVNGDFDPEASSTHAMTAWDFGGLWVVGRDYTGGSRWIGQVDELRHYEGKALTADEVKLLYDQPNYTVLAGLS